MPRPFTAEELWKLARVGQPEVIPEPFGGIGRGRKSADRIRETAQLGVDHAQIQLHANEMLGQPQRFGDLEGFGQGREGAIPAARVLMEQSEVIVDVCNPDSVFDAPVGRKRVHEKVFRFRHQAVRP